MSAWFTWKGRDSREMGIVVTDAPPHVFPEERVTQISVPGRPGTVVITEGEGVYNAYVKTIGIANRHTVDFREIAAWLRGSGELIISTEPNYAYEARIINEAQIERLWVRNYSGPVDFLVQPLKAEYPPQGELVLGTTASGSASIHARGDVPARPVYTVLGSGDMQLTVGTASEDGSGSLIQIALPEGETGVVIDTNAAMVTNLNGTVNLSYVCSLFYNGFKGMWLPQNADTSVSWNENITQVRMDPRWRWL